MRTKLILTGFFISVLYLTVKKLPRINQNLYNQVIEQTLKPEVINDSNKSLNSFKNLSLLTVTNSHFADYLWSSLKPSLDLFWPRKYLDLTIITESPSLLDKVQHDFIKTVNEIPYAKIIFELPISPSITGDGHAKQQLHMFEADLYIKDKEYVGFVDTDTTFIVPVIPESIFDNGKPIVRGIRGGPIIPHSPFWEKMPANTARILSLPEVGGFMTYFPVIVKLEHLKELREYCEEKFKKDFRTVFKEDIRSDIFSQFSIMLNYMFHFHKDEYSWHIYDIFGGDDREKNELKYYNTAVPGIKWNQRKESELPGLMKMSESDKLLTEAERAQFYQVATHSEA